MRALQDALRFLTVVPSARAGPPTAAAVAAFPVVGLFIGSVWTLLAATEQARLFPSTAVIAALILLVDAAVTGALHLDALADVADGVASRRRPNEALAIMREPTIGAVGAAVLLLVCLLRFALLVTAVDYARALVAAPVAGRAAMALVLRLTPVREDGSLAAAFAAPRNVHVGVAAVLAAAAAWVAAGQRGLVALGAALVFTLLYGRWWRRRFGGLSGDGAGACGILAETVALLVVAARVAL